MPARPDLHQLLARILPCLLPAIFEQNLDESSVIILPHPYTECPNLYASQIRLPATRDQLPLTSSTTIRLPVFSVRPRYVARRDMPSPPRIPFFTVEAWAPAPHATPMATAHLPALVTADPWNAAIHPAAMIFMTCADTASPPVTIADPPPWCCTQCGDPNPSTATRCLGVSFDLTSSECPGRCYDGTPHPPHRTTAPLRRALHLAHASP